MPNTTFDSDLKKGIVLDAGTIRQISNFFHEYFERPVEIVVSFSDDTKTTYADVDKVIEIDNVEDRSIQSIKIGAAWKFGFNGYIEFNNKYRSVRMHIDGEEEKVLKVKQFFTEKIGKVTQWYSPVYEASEFIHGIIFAAKTVIWMASFGLAVIPPFENATGFLMGIITLMPFILFVLDFMAIKILKLSFPLTVFALGKHYENFMIRKKVFVSILSFIIAVGIGGFWYLVDKTSQLEVPTHMKSDSEAR